MIRLRRSASIAGSIFIIAGLVTAVAVHGALSGPSALASTTVPGTDIFGQTTVTSWPEVRSAGMNFAGIQAYDGATIPNKNYAAQVTGALIEGLYVMPYVFADPLKIAGGAQFAKAWSVIDSVAGAPYGPGGQLLPIALDLENDPAVTSKYCYGLTPAKMVSWISAFTAAAKAQTRVVPVIYTSRTWWNQCAGSSAAFSGDPLWVVDYGVSAPAIPGGWTSYALWQSSDTGSVGGIAGAADLDQLQAAPNVTVKAGTSGSAQLETLNSLAGQPVAYARDSALPAGVSLTSSGRLSWSSATRAGGYQLTVTPASETASPVTPSALAVTLRVHATIVLSTRNRSSTVGVRIRLGIPYSGADAKAGFKPTLKVTGLPPGLSLSSGNLITGRASRRGTYKVTVTATDALGGTGRATFTWTIKAASDIG